LRFRWYCAARALSAAAVRLIEVAQHYYECRAAALAGTDQ